MQRVAIRGRHGDPNIVQPIEEHPRRRGACLSRVSVDIQGRSLLVKSGQRGAFGRLAMAQTGFLERAI